MFKQDYQICILRSQRNVLGEASFLESLPHNYGPHSKKLRVSCGKPFGKVVKTEPYVSTRSYRIGTFFEILINFFGCQNRLLRVQMILLDRNTFRKFFQFLLFWTVSSNFSNFRQKIQWLGCPNYLLWVQRRFLKRKRLFARKRFFSINFWLWADDFRVSGIEVRICYKNWFLQVQRRFTKKKDRLKTFFLL